MNVYSICMVVVWMWVIWLVFRVSLLVCFMRGVRWFLSLVVFLMLRFLFSLIVFIVVLDKWFCDL